MKPVTIEIVKLGERFSERYEVTCDVFTFPGQTPSCGTVFRYTVFDFDPHVRSDLSRFIRCPACGRCIDHAEENRVP